MMHLIFFLCKLTSIRRIIDANFLGKKLQCIRNTTLLPIAFAAW
jgi:hypothetical protein